MATIPLLEDGERVRGIGLGKAVVRLLDFALRRFMGIREYCRQPDCVFRIALVHSPDEVRLADGTLVRRGDLVGDLHYWNEHMPALPEGKPALAWALAADRAVRRSLRELVEFVEHDPRYREVRAFTGEMGGLPIRGARRLASAGGRYGFESRPVEPPHGPAGRLRRWGEDVLLLLLAWGFNPASLWRRGARPARCRLWMSREMLLSRYGCADV
jgi:hypothetical protein